MTTLVVTLDEVCAGGGHFTIGYVVNGGTKKQRIFNRDDFETALNGEDVESFLKALCRLSGMGKTRAQLKTALTNGLTINV